MEAQRTVLSYAEYLEVVAAPRHVRNAWYWTWRTISVLTAAHAGESVSFHV